MLQFRSYARQIFAGLAKANSKKSNAVYGRKCCTLLVLSNFRVIYLGSNLNGIIAKYYIFCIFFFAIFALFFPG